MRKKQNPVPMLPVSLLVAGRACLVVGGGSVALRKVGHLLDAEALVTVVAPRIVEGLAALVRDEKICHIADKFDATHVDGKYLVYAATDSETVNRSVLEACCERGALCSAIDSNWPNGDLVMPAICRKGGFTISVATGGKSCTQARIMKERIAELIDTFDEEVEW